ncbi:MAG TPA: hypothetical protein VIW26_13980 [Gemmatimonadales bacterium]|jgi:protein-S-isoprenylcysteine O-methyltransferase Ste14
MKLDLRYPIGLLFTVFGVIITIYGIVSNRMIYEKSLGMDVNLWWGLVLLGFGLAMLSFAVRGSGKGSS